VHKVLIICGLIISLKLFAKSTKEIWLDYHGTSDCENHFCADGIPALPLELSLNFLKNNARIIENTKFLAIADFRMPSTKKRLFILNLEDGSVTSMLVTHGKKSEGRKAYADNFSNDIGSEMSSLGFYLTEDAPYIGKHGTSLRLEGLSKTNSNALDRGIVFHSADYASEWFIEERGRLGLSQGCPAVSNENIAMLIKKLKGRSLFLIYADSFLLKLTDTNGDSAN
jgi:hypothetical protein